MKIGILSMQRVNNYGSFFQALSLKSILEELGNTVEFIDIISGKRYDGNTFKDSGAKDWNNEEFVKFRKKRDEIISSYGKEYLGLTEKENYRNNYDFAVIGSDEVFNCIGVNVGCSEQLYGKDVSKYTITYAASCGHTTFEQVEKYDLVKYINEAMKHLKSISVRDKNTYEFVKRISGRTPEEHLDPVFIYDFDKYSSNIEIDDKDYIIIYSYDYRLCNEKEVKKIKEFAQKNNLKTIGVGLYQPWCDKNINVTPFELLQYFKNASYVITDTFHGAVFSIKYNKKFVGISRSSNSNKFNDLLQRFDLSSQNIEDIDNLENIIQNDIDYERVNKFILEQTEQSRKYLESELEKAQTNLSKYNNKAD